MPATPTHPVAPLRTLTRKKGMSDRTSDLASRTAIFFRNSEPITRGADSFEHDPGRDLAYSARDDRARSRSDLERNIDRLPTALNTHALDHVMRADGRRLDSKHRLESNCNASGETGGAGCEALVVLDSVARRAGPATAGPVLEYGPVVVEIENKTPHPFRMSWSALRPS